MVAPTSGVAPAMADTAPPEQWSACDLESTYVRIWALQQLVPFMDLLLLGAGLGAVDNRPLIFADWLILPFVILLAALPVRRLAVALQVANIAIRLVRMPFIWDHECWAMWTEFTFVLILGWESISGEKGGEGSSAILRVFAVVRTQMVILYFSAATWKLTTSFLDHRTSCGTLLVLELLSSYLPEEALSSGSPLAMAAARAAPLCTVIMEFAIPALLMLGRSRTRLGLVLGLIFHFTILLLPVNCAGGFSMACAVRYCAFLPLSMGCGSGARQASNGALRRPVRATSLDPLPSAAAVALCSIVAAMRWQCALRPPDAAFVSFGALAALYLRAIAKEHFGGAVSTAALPGQGAVVSSCGFCSFALIAGTACYAFLGPVIGLQHMGASTMYGNVKHYGGSNHLLLPTGIFFDIAAIEVRPAWLPRFVVSGFEGGLVRVDATTSATFRAQNPADASGAFAQHTREVLRSVGHSGIQFAPYYARVDSSATALNASGAQLLDQADLSVPYVIPFFELRRLLLEARRQGQTNFAVSYTRMPYDVRSPGGWRREAGQKVHLHVGASAMASAGWHMAVAAQVTGVLCTQDGGEPCNSEELALLSIPPPWWLLKLALVYPYPLLQHDEREIHCAS